MYDENMEQRAQRIHRLRAKIERLGQQQERVPSHLRHAYSHELHRLQEMLLEAEQAQHEALARHQPGQLAKQSDYDDLEHELDTALARFGAPD